MKSVLVTFKSPKGELQTLKFQNVENYTYNHPYGFEVETDKEKFFVKDEYLVSYSIAEILDETDTKIQNN